MPRWDPEGEKRLADAAVALFLEHGFENVTVTQITERAGLNRRTFSRYFADKRDVLFAGAEQLPALMAEALRRADLDLTPFDALMAAFADVGAVLGTRVAPHAAHRRQIVARSPELQERGRTKFAEVAEALTAVLRARGSDPASAALLAQVGVAIFQSGFNRWVDDPARQELAASLMETGAELAHAVTPQPASR